MGNLSSGDYPGEDGVTRTEDADADGFFTCERCGKRKPVGFTCACGGHGGGEPVTPQGWDPELTRSSRPRLSIVRRPEQCDGPEQGVDAGRAADKPIPSGAISRRAVTVLALASGLASLGFALALGPATLGLAAVGLACAWSYDLWLKGTAASVLPFAIALPLVPLFGYGAAGRFPPVLWWAWPIGALAAVAVHLADSLPDVESDRAAGVHGLAPRLGVRAAGTLVAAAYLVAVAIALGSGLAAGDAPVVLVGVVLAAALGLAALAAGSGADQRHRRVAYRLLLAGLVALALGWAAAVRP